MLPRLVNGAVHRRRGEQRGRDELAIRHRLAAEVDGAHERADADAEREQVEERLEEAGDEARATRRASSRCSARRGARTGRRRADRGTIRSAGVDACSSLQLPVSERTATTAPATTVARAGSRRGRAPGRPRTARARSRQSSTPCQSGVAQASGSTQSGSCESGRTSREEEERHETEAEDRGEPWRFSTHEVIAAERRRKRAHRAARRAARAPRAVTRSRRPIAATAAKSATATAMRTAAHAEDARDELAHREPASRRRAWYVRTH